MEAEQTHRSLARYLLEETHETLEAIDTGDETGDWEPPARGARRPAAAGLLPRRDRRGVRRLHHRRRGPRHHREDVPPQPARLRPAVRRPARRRRAGERGLAGDQGPGQAARVAHRRPARHPARAAVRHQGGRARRIGSPSRRADRARRPAAGPGRGGGRRGASTPSRPCATPYAASTDHLPRSPAAATRLAAQQSSSSSPHPGAPTRGIHRSCRRPRDPRLARQPHRRGRGAPRRRDLRPSGGPQRRVHRRVRGGRAARRRRPLSRQGRPERGGRGHPDPRPRGRGPRRRRPAAGRPDHARRRRHPQQGPARRQRDPRRLARRRPRRGRLGRPAALPLRRRSQRAPAAGADDEHRQRRRARRLQRRRAGVHDRADRSADVQGGAALGRRGLPRAQVGAEEEGALDRPGRRGRLRAQPRLQPGRARPDRRGRRGVGAEARHRHRPRDGRGGQRVLQGWVLRVRGRHQVQRRDDGVLRRALSRRTRSSRSRTRSTRTTGTAGRPSPTSSATRSRSSATTCSSPTSSGSSAASTAARPTPCW